MAGEVQNDFACSMRYTELRYNFDQDRLACNLLLRHASGAPLVLVSLVNCVWEVPKPPDCLLRWLALAAAGRSHGLRVGPGIAFPRAACKRQHMLMLWIRTEATLAPCLGTWPLAGRRFPRSYRQPAGKESMPQAVLHLPLSCVSVRRPPALCHIHLRRCRTAAAAAGTASDECDCQSAAHPPDTSNEDHNVIAMPQLSHIAAQAAPPPPSAPRLLTALEMLTHPPIPCAAASTWQAASWAGLDS